MRIVGYVFRSDIICPTCIRHYALTNLPSEDDDMPTEHYLDLLAVSMDIDRYDEASYDSGKFPKVIFSFDLDGRPNCGTCLVPIKD